jgi:hypothetical protein
MVTSLPTLPVVERLYQYKGNFCTNKTPPNSNHKQDDAALLSRYSLSRLILVNDFLSSWFFDFDSEILEWSFSIENLKWPGGVLIDFRRVN